MKGFLSQYPEISVDLRDGDAMIDLVQERFDLAIMPVSPPDSTLVRRTLAKWHPVLCCAPAYLEKRPEPRSPADLVGHNCLLYAHTPFRDRWPFLDARGNTLVARVPATLVTTSITVLRAVAVAGLGLWLSAPFIVSDLLASKELVPLLRDYRLPEMEIVALYPHRQHLTAKVRAFLDMLVDQFSNAQRRLAPARVEQSYFRLSNCSMPRFSSPETPKMRFTPLFSGANTSRSAPFMVMLLAVPAVRVGFPGPFIEWRFPLVGTGPRCDRQRDAPPSLRRRNRSAARQ